jgi:hypothetical protein
MKKLPVSVYAALCMALLSTVFACAVGKSDSSSTAPSSSSLVSNGLSFFGGDREKYSGRYRRKFVKQQPQIFGPWRNYLQAVNPQNGVEYSLQSSYRVAAAIRFKLLKPYDGNMETAASTFKLASLDDSGAQMENAVLSVSSVEKFNSFIKREAGAEAVITFDLLSKDRKTVKSIYKRIAGFEGIQAAPVRERRVIAVARLTRGTNTSAQAVELIRNAVTAALLKNKNAAKFAVVDTGYIDQIVTQHSFELSDWSDSAKVAAIGNALNADIIALGEVTTKNNAGAQVYDITLQFLDINSMEVLGSLIHTYRANGMTREGSPGSGDDVSFTTDIVNLNLKL